MRGGGRGDPFSQHRSMDFEDVPAGQTYMPSQMASPQSRQQLPTVDRGDGSMSPTSPLIRYESRRRPSRGSPASYRHQAAMQPMSPAAHHDPYYQQGYQEASPNSMDPTISVSRFDGRPLGPAGGAARPGHPYGPPGGQGYNYVPHGPHRGGDYYYDGRPPSRPVPEAPPPPHYHPHQPQHQHQPISPLPLPARNGRPSHYLAGDLSPHSGHSGDVSPASYRGGGKAPSLKADCIGGGDALWRRIKAWVTGGPDPNTKNGVCYYDDGAPSATAMLMTTHHEVPPLHKLAQPPTVGYDGYEVSMMYDGRHEATVYGPPIRSVENQKMRPCCKLILVLLAILLLVISIFATVTMLLKMHQHKFNCSSDTLDSQDGWSFEKKVWCCENKNVGCQMDHSSDSQANMITVQGADVMLATTKTYTTTSTTPFYPCDVLQFSSWDAGQQAWCCLHLNRGCPQTTTEIPYDCEANLANWTTLWSAGKKDWCCRRERVGCPFEVPSPPELPPKPIGLGYNCASGWSNWEIGWSKEKKAWCCEFENLGCPYTTTTGVPAGAHCDINCNIHGEDSSCRKRVHWVVEHRKRSCQESLRDVVAECEMCYRCDLSTLQCQEPFDCHSNQNNMNQWSNEQKEFCCRSSGVSCGVIPYNCFDKSHPMNQWTEGKRVWCCEKEKLGCHRP